MNLSLIYVSHRPGGFDLLADWLSRQSGVDFDLIVVDGKPMRVRDRVVVPFMAKTGAAVRWYGEPKMRTFPYSSIGYVNAVNTGLLHAGDHFVVVHDFITAPPGTLAAFAAAFADRPRSLVCGDRSRCVAEEPSLGLHDCLTWDEPPKLTPADKGEGFQLGLWGGPTALMEECNGMDERSDLCHGWALNDLRAKADRLSWELRREPSIPYFAIDHHGWGFGQPAHPHTVFRSLPVPDVSYAPAWTGWSANPFNLKYERKRR